jgi:hypothetical protein
MNLKWLTPRRSGFRRYQDVRHVGVSAADPAVGIQWIDVVQNTIATVAECPNRVLGLDR